MNEGKGKAVKRNKKKKPLKCVNGVKGAISLFLAVLLTPFLSIALLLVEAGRYNSSVSLLDEAMSVSSYSVLAEYDSYLLERWGILGLAQDADMQEKFSGYMDVNTSVAGSALSWSNPMIKGTYPLSDTDVLHNQIMEYSKLNVPTKLASRLFSAFGDVLGNLDKPAKLDDLLSKITSSVQLFDSACNTLTSGIKVLDGAIDLVDSAEKMKESAEKLETLKAEYETTYNAFANNVNNLIYWYGEKARLESEIKAKESELTGKEQDLAELEESEEDTEDSGEELEDEISELESEIQDLKSSLSNAKSNISSYISSSETAKSNYSAKIAEIQTELTNFRDKASAALTAIKDVSENIIGAMQSGLELTEKYTSLKNNLEAKQKDLAAAERELEEWEEKGYSTDDPSYIAGLEMKISLEEEVNELQSQLAPIQTEISITQGGKTALEGMTDSFSTSFDDYDDNVISQIITGFGALKEKVDALNISAINANSPRITVAEYHSIAVGGYIASDEIDEFLKSEEEKLRKGSFSEIVDALMAVYNSVMGLSIFFEDDLSACLNLSYYEENFGGLPGGCNTKGDVIDLMYSLGDLVKDVIAFKNDYNTLKFWKLLNDLRDIAKSMLNLIEAIGQFICVIVQNIKEVLTGYDRWYLTTYCTYNLACRTDFKASLDKMSFKNMSEQSFGDDSFPDQNSGFSVPVFGEIIALVNTIRNNINGTGEDLTFSGAELEYVLFGSTNEVVNQLYVFCLLYIFRLLQCIPAISANVEVQGLAAASTFGYPVVMGLFYVFEPLVEVVLLCNGKSEPLFPTKVYLSPSGIPDLLKSLVFFCKLTNVQKKDIEEKAKKAFKASDQDIEYQESLFEQSGQNDYSAPKLFDFSYRDFCMILLLITVGTDRMVERVANVIQMESLYYYQQQKATYTFDLRKSFTFIHTSVDVKVGQIMPDMLEAALFSTTREQYRGY